MSLTVIYEDNHVLVAEKPHMIPSQGDASGDESMVLRVKTYLKETYKKPGNIYLGLLHRLDRPTGGLMLFAKTSKAATRLSKEIKEQRVTKKYLAVVHGSPKKKEKLEDYLYKDKKENIVYVCDTEKKDAKYAALTYETLAKGENKSLLDITLATGRSHQIRVQLSSRGFPIVGDVKYGKGERTGLLLYAYQIGFLHPTLKKQILVTHLPCATEFAPFAAEIAALQAENQEIWIAE
ncbi:MAG: RluA family pseudouridine synthase [Christensenellaceae bacterium]|jgi:23S rRNA pseudouridine1911/1915/1917 synthase